MQDTNRIGVVSKVDRKNGMISVVYGDRDGKVTQPLPFLNFNDEYKMPKPGDYVAVMHLSNGMEMGAVLGKYWNEKDKPVDEQDTYRKQFDYDGKAYMKYDEKTGELVIRAPKIKIVADEESMETQAPEYKVTAKDEKTGTTGSISITGGISHRITEDVPYHPHN